MSQSYDLKMSLGESYIEGIATSNDKEYRINIQAGTTCLVLPSEFEGGGHATINFFTEKGNHPNIETPVQYNMDWIQIYDDSLTATLSSDLPFSITIDYIDR
jgi:hypothetical protein